MAQIYIDGKAYEVQAGENLLQICLSLGFNLPYFCWHPALGSVGSCRQCAIKHYKDGNDTKGKIVMACMTAAEDGMHISVDDQEAREFRSGVIEWLMLNHPHDCPVCDEGGECHLQDMTVMTGHNYRESRFNKRTHRNQYLGPFIHHEMNRCIACYRCVRFYRDYADGRDFNVFGAHNHVYFGRHSDGLLENEFSGNLVEVCPTGVFTDKILKKHYTRKWDLQTAPSVCVHCGLGCNTIPGERYGTLRRIQNRYNREINGYFLCDRGRYGYEFVNSEHRIRKPFIRASREHTVLEYAATLLSKKAQVIGIGSPRASLESNFALRTLVGPDNFYLGMSDADSRLTLLMLKIMSENPAKTASLHDVKKADAAFVLGEDVTHIAPLLALSLRESARVEPGHAAEKLKIADWNAAAVREVIQDRRGPLFIAAPYRTRLDDAAMETYHAASDDLARLGFAVAHALNPQSPAVPNLPENVHSLADRIAKSLKEAKRPLVVSGAGCGSEAVIQAAANVALALCGKERHAQLCFTVPECNTLGLALMGGRSLTEAFEAVRAGKADTAIILENDLYRRASAHEVDSFFKSVKHPIVLDYLANATTEKAEVLFPAAAFAESNGTIVNNECRAQRYYKVFPPADEIKESWRWLSDLITVSRRSGEKPWENFDALVAATSEALPIFESITGIAPSADFRMNGQKIPRQPHRYTGRTAMNAHINVSEPKPPHDPDSPLSFSMEGYDGQPPSATVPRYWSPGWNSVQALNHFQKKADGTFVNNNLCNRLIGPVMLEQPHYYCEIPAKFSPRENEWLVIPIHHIFGSEELSILSSGIAELAPKPYCALNPEDAKQRGLENGKEIEVELCGVKRRLTVKLLNGLPHGVAGAPTGLPQLQGLTLPVWARIESAL